MRRQARCLLVALGLVVGASTGAALSAIPRLTLTQAQAAALANHPGIKAVAFDTAAAQEAVNIARSIYAPQVYGIAVSAFAPTNTRVSAYVGGLTDPTILQRTGTGLVVSQYVTDFGRTADVVRSYQLATQAQAERTALTQLTVLLNVTQAYFEVLRADALIRVAVETVRERQTLLRQVRVLQRAGLRSTLDVSIAQRDAAAANQLAVVAESRRSDAMAELTEAMGSPVQTDYHLVDIRRMPAIPTSVGPLIDEMLTTNPQLAAIRFQAASAQITAAAVRKATLPVVTAYGYFGGTPIRAANQEINEAYSAAGIAMTVPLENGGELRAEARQAQDRAWALAESSQNVENELLRNTRTAYEDVVAARSNIDLTSEMVRTARESLRLTAERYRIGLNSIVDLSQAQLALTQAEIAHANAIYDYIEQGAALEFVTGALAPGL